MVVKRCFLASCWRLLQVHWSWFCSRMIIVDCRICSDDVKKCNSCICYTDHSCCPVFRFFLRKLFADLWVDLVRSVLFFILCVSFLVLFCWRLVADFSLSFLPAVLHCTGTDFLNSPSGYFSDKLARCILNLFRKGYCSDGEGFSPQFLSFPAQRLNQLLLIIVWNVSFASEASAFTRSITANPFRP